MKEILKKGLDSFSGEYADIRYEIRRKTTIIFKGKELEKASREISQGGGVRVFNAGSEGFATFSRPEDVKNAVAEADRLSKVARPEKEAHLVEVKPIVADFIPALNRDPRKISLEEKVELLKKYNDIALSGGEKITSTTSVYQDEEVERYYISTDGTIVKEVRVYSGIRVSVLAADGSNVQAGSVTFGDQRGFETVLDKEEDVENAIKDAISLLSAERVQGGTYTVILDPEIAGVFIHEAFGHLSEADHIYRNDKLQEIMIIGKRFGPDFLNVVDDGSLKGERGYIAIDDDGVLPERTYIIKNGKLNARLHSRFTAALMNETPTGNSRALNFAYVPLVRMTNTFIESQDASFEELLEGIERGLYVVGAIGGQTELEMFTFSSQKAYEIVNGKVGKMVRDVVLTGNVFETLMNIEKVGNDFKLHGGLGGCGKGGQMPLPVSHGGPHIRIRNVVIGGTR